MTTDYMKPDLDLPVEIFEACAIYGWYRNPDYLYIGQSYKVIQRIVAHGTLGVVEPYLEGDKIHIWFCEYKQLDDVEAALIRAFKPRHNTFRPDSSTSSI